MFEKYVLSFYRISTGLPTKDDITETTVLNNCCSDPCIHSETVDLFLSVPDH